ncbi:MAG TPA: KpsF/GutQ family sugar-phosphate isomerase [Thermohalobaculum sp.]|nr:KpsF/GutQ family sugar-phosphate isomerase [Thermohalobaculum sp.]
MEATNAGAGPRPGAAGQTLETARRVLRLEADALASFADSLDTAFSDAVELMLRTEGRVIVSGVGKSGHVGRKVAATLASTGTPAFFVHASEASHGDLGMITPHDVALLLSNSGETKELADVIAHTRRFSIPLIGVASRPESTLMKAADVALALPQAPEACAVGMAPTTSTTLTMALGDALAVALMERRGFTPEHFHVFHPGGRLGARLIKVSDLMATGSALPLVPAPAPMSEALIEMSRKSFGAVGIQDQHGLLQGIITDGDLRRNMEGLLDRRAGEVATPGPETIRPDQLAGEALAVMNARKITCLFVTAADDPRRPVGLLHIHDCLRAGVDA